MRLEGVMIILNLIELLINLIIVFIVSTSLLLIPQHNRRVLRKWKAESLFGFCLTFFIWIGSITGIISIIAAPLLQALASTLPLLFAYYRESEVVSEVYRRKKEILPLAFQLILRETVPKHHIDRARKCVQKDTRNAVLKVKDELLEFFQ